MRPVLVVALVLSLTLAVTPVAEGREWRPDLAAAQAYADDRMGHITFAVRTPRHLYAIGGARTTSSASVVKAMLMVAYLNRGEVRHRRLTGAERALLGPMIRRSANANATRVRDIVGNGALELIARRVGMHDFATAPTWGATQISARDQTKLFLGIDRLIARRHRAFAMRLLASIAPDQRWGIARARPPGWSLFFKSGWYEDFGTNHQSALLRRGEQRVAVAILGTGGPSHTYAKRTLRGVARRLLRGLRPDSVPR